MLLQAAAKGSGRPPEPPGTSPRGRGVTWASHADSATRAILTRQSRGGKATGMSPDTREKAKLLPCSEHSMLSQVKGLRHLMTHTHTYVCLDTHTPAAAAPCAASLRACPPPAPPVPAQQQAPQSHQPTGPSLAGCSGCPPHHLYVNVSVSVMREERVGENRTGRRKVRQARGAAIC